MRNLLLVRPQGYGLGGLLHLWNTVTLYTASLFLTLTLASLCANPPGLTTVSAPPIYAQWGCTLTLPCYLICWGCGNHQTAFGFHLCPFSPHPHHLHPDIPAVRFLSVGTS